MQQIYTHRDEQLEVFTTVFSPQVCRTRVRHAEAEKVVVVTNQYRSRWPKELDLEQGDLIQVLFKDDESWWFGRLANGDEGYFPSSCVELLQDSELSRATPTQLRRGSVPAMVRTRGAPCGCTSGRSTPKLLRKNSVQQPSESRVSGASTAPLRSSSFFCRVLAKSRRKSCPLLPRAHLDTSSDNTAFQPD
ncbi:jouberin isoform X2 [Girardinichthys multiradiatus]|uniref:jouberin isoform X2 n=1 Tax=Girardinichthys multiradiatus TaxID=208333 RepID=UPI001FACB619|nr:jouberin isoform X2 [Girardinichthys multiradiatus]